MSEKAMFKLCTFAVVFVLVSLLKSCNELSYMMNGKETQARLLSIKEVEESKRGRRGIPRGSRTRLEVKYTFDDEHVDRPRVEAFRILPDFELPIGNDEQGRDVVDIEYMPGQKMISRLAGHDDKMWVYIFFGSLGTGAAVAGIACYRFYKS